MLIYSVTVNLQQEIWQEWLSWMKSVHIPDVLATGCFTEHRISKVTQPSQDDGSITFNIQYYCLNEDILEQYLTIFAPKLQKLHTDRYHGKFVAFRSILQDLT
jgi:hypothetical protein